MKIIHTIVTSKNYKERSGFFIKVNNISYVVRKSKIARAINLPAKNFPIPRGTTWDFFL